MTRGPDGEPALKKGCDYVRPAKEQKECKQAGEAEEEGKCAEDEY